MKKSIFAFSLILMLLFSLGVSAFADDAKFEVTKNFVEGLAELDGATATVQPDMLEIGSTAFEVVKIDYEGDLSEYKSHFNIGFSEDCSQVLLSMSIMNIDEAKLADVINAVNNLNATSTSVKLYVDSDRNIVVGELYLLATKDSVLDIAGLGTGLFIRFTDSVYEALKDFEA